MRVFLGLTEVSGYYARLRDGLREHGVEADLVTLNRHHFGYAPDAAPRVARLLIAPARHLREMAAAHPGRRARVIRALELPVRALTQVALLAWACARYDVFVFGFSASFLRTHDLPALRLLRKRVVAVYHGSDSRPPYIDGFVARDASPRELARCTRRVAARCRRMERWADVIVCGPLSAHFFRRPVVTFQRVGLPVPPGDTGAHVARVAQPGALRIVHAPSDPVGKGTDRVRASIATLRAEGVQIDYVELSGRPNAEVLAELRACDLVVDQVYSDIPFAGLPTEAARFGRPSVVGTMGLDEVRGLVPGADWPVVLTDPDGLTDAIRGLCLDPDRRGRIGAAAGELAHREWTPAAVAARMLRLVRGDIPPDWLFDPAQLRYVYGVGLSGDAVRRRVCTLVDECGIAALRLAHNPALEAEFVRRFGLDQLHAARVAVEAPR